MRIPKTERVALETGVYPATIRKIEMTEGKFGPQLQWDFDIVGASAEEGGQQRAWTGTTMTDKNKTGRWVKAVLGEVPEELDTDDLWGKPCRLSLTVKTGADGGEFNRVDEVLPPRAPKANKATIKPESETEEAVAEPVAETPF